MPGVDQILLFAKRKPRSIRAVRDDHFCRQKIIKTSQRKMFHKMQILLFFVTIPLWICNHPVYLKRVLLLLSNIVRKISRIAGIIISFSACKPGKGQPVLPDREEAKWKQQYLQTFAVQIFDKIFHTLSPLVFRCLFMLFPGKSIIFPHTMESIGSKIITGFQDAKTQVTIYHKGHSRRLQFIS